MVESLRRQDIALILKVFDKVKEQQKGDFSLKDAHMRTCSMIHQGQVWGNIFSDISRREKDEGYRQRYTLEEWNMGKFLA